MTRQAVIGGLDRKMSGEQWQATDIGTRDQYRVKIQRMVTRILESHKAATQHIHDKVARQEPTRADTQTRSVAQCGDTKSNKVGAKARFAA